MSEISKFYQRLNKFVKQSGKSFNRVEKELGYPRNSLNNYKNGTEPSGFRLVEIAQYFGISSDYLIGRTDDPCIDQVTSTFKSLSEEEKLEMLSLAQQWGENKIKELNNK
ncbi:helix-turn-helix transcriptional regulator [Lactococcus lactis]|uniref:helix-turn-helix domain-containing protein n=1 Tax=Lactococcus lactis TaxID=1358 RepID=UPI001D194102|nr:helix-turn-helix transcriptional regulator [Lactococcus lactis]MCC4119931.1 helix-turn-helix domain-containing protein [Lactococcus lactis]MCT1191649.1 XRE family transcriptional regulator [Lactococcus lactis]MCT3091935.1 XRE family transcriptional regulator [Lactococcus lactis]MDG4987009.1 helix-turn-helix domain-containing protein [Lactococcus lactis]